MAATCSPRLRVLCASYAPGLFGSGVREVADRASATSCLSMRAQRGGMAALGGGMPALGGGRAVQGVEEGGPATSLREDGAQGRAILANATGREKIREGLAQGS